MTPRWPGCAVFARAWADVRADVAAVLLDVDDTVVDTRAAFRAAIHAVARAHLPQLSEATRELAFEHWVRDAGRHFAAFTRGELTFEAQRRRRAADLHDAFDGPAVDDALFERWNTLYSRAFRDAWAPVDGAHELVRGLVEAGVPFGAVTNSVASYQTEKLEATGLGALRVLVGTDTFGVGKPDRRVFLRGCELLGSDPARTVYVGDEPLVDAAGAAAAGLIGVWLDPFGDGLRPESGRTLPPSGLPVVRSLAELAAWLQLTT